MGRREIKNTPVRNRGLPTGETGASPMLLIQGYAMPSKVAVRTFILALLGQMSIQMMKKTALACKFHLPGGIDLKKESTQKAQAKRTNLGSSGLGVSCFPLIDVRNGPSAFSELPPTRLILATKLAEVNTKYEKGEKGCYFPRLEESLTTKKQSDYLPKQNHLLK